MARFDRFLMSLRSSPRRAVMVEVAFLAPAMMLAATGAICWLCYLRLSHQVQLVADRALAAAQSAPSEATREPFALAAARREVSRQGLAPHGLDLTLQRRTHDLTLLLVYDASAAPIFALSSYLPMPMPSATIVRMAEPKAPPR